MRKSCSLQPLINAPFFDSDGRVKPDGITDEVSALEVLAAASPDHALDRKEQQLSAGACRRWGHPIAG